MFKRLEAIDGKGVGTVCVYTDAEAARTCQPPLSTFRIVATAVGGQSQYEALAAVMDVTDPNVDPVAQEAAIEVAKAAAEPDLGALRAQAKQAVVDINAFLSIASPSNAQIIAEVRAIDQRQRAIIRALARLAALTP